jgi:hypothetical protein
MDVVPGKFREFKNVQRPLGGDVFIPPEEIGGGVFEPLKSEALQGGAEHVVQKRGAASRAAADHDLLLHQLGTKEPVSCLLRDLTANKQASSEAESGWCHGSYSGFKSH